MNKVILLGRLTKDPEVSYTSGAEPLAVAKYSLAVNRKFKREGEADADFINCVAFGKSAEFCQRFFKKGQMVGVVGRLQIRSWDDNEGKKRWTTEVIIDEQHFAESRSAFEAHQGQTQYQQSPKPQAKPMPQPQEAPPEGFYPIDESIEDDDLPF